MKNLFQRHPFFRRALLVIVIFYCFRGAVLEFRASRHYQQVAKWPVTEAVISSSAVYWTSYSWSGRRTRYCPKLRYTYAVQGQKYDEYNEVFDFVCWPDAYDFVSQHQPGATIKVAYDPKKPAVSIAPEAVRDPGYPWGDIIGGVVFSAFLLIDLFGAWTTDSTPDNRVETAPHLDNE